MPMTNSNVSRLSISFLFGALLALSAALAIPSAFATSSSNCTPINCNLHGATVDIGPLGVNPCNGQPSTTDSFVTGNFAFHGSADGTHSTGTIEGQVSFAQDNGVTYTGHLTDWFGGNVNNGAAEFTGTVNANLVGSDGTTIHLNGVMHMTMTPSGAITANVNNLNCH
jgi:hypothetical protein